MALIETKGRARQKAYTLAKKAGVEIKAVVFSKREAEKALGYKLRGRKCTKNDNAIGRCFTDSKVIWLDMPVSVETIAHEVMHLVTSTSHRKSSFNNRVVALRRGVDITKAKIEPHSYEVTITDIRTYRVFELSAHYAKKNYLRGTLQPDPIRTIKARRM